MFTGGTIWVLTHGHRLLLGQLELPGPRLRVVPVDGAQHLACGVPGAQQSAPNRASSLEGKLLGVG